MRVFISADMEGVTGIADPRDIIKGETDYADGTELMIGDVNAAVEGALAGGSDKIVVNDSHWTMTNLPQAQLHEEARLIRGSSKRRLMMEGFTGNHTIAFFVGYHAKAGTPQAVLNHTMYPQMLIRVRVNDQEVGEMGLNAGLAKHYGVPVGLVTGDDKTAEEAEDEFGKAEVETVAVKQGIDRFTADNLPLSEARDRIRTAAKRAVERADNDSFEQLQFEEPVRIEIEWAATNHAYRASELVTVERTGGRTTRVKEETYPEAYDATLAMIRSASAAYNELFTW
jgi:D-amino peptidase